MSNVLIGIIGVILFIGLALAGALFLGPRFQEATNNSKASAVVQANAQLAQAAAMYRVQEGREWDNTRPEGLMPSYIKAMPTNVTSGQLGYGYRALDGNLAISSTVAPGYSTTGWLPDDEAGRTLCGAIARQSGQTVGADGSPPSAAAPQGTSGCIRISGTTWGNLNGVYLGYARI
jgi:type II secretory pathway pseudopilin PulG